MDLYSKDLAFCNLTKWITAGSDGFSGGGTGSHSGQKITVQPPGWTVYFHHEPLFRSTYRYVRGSGGLRVAGKLLASHKRREIITHFYLHLLRTILNAQQALSPNNYLTTLFKHIPNDFFSPPFLFLFFFSRQKKKKQDVETGMLQIGRDHLLSVILNQLSWKTLKEKNQIKTPHTKSLTEKNPLLK